MKEWPKKISVDKRIVQILSGSTYENFPQSIRELIINSYDADATEVKVTINIQEEIITIEDNGHGMDEDDFDFYLRIAFKKRQKNDTTRLGRKIIGQFGVGFLSIFPYCSKYSIESKKKGNNDIVYANINCAKYFSENSNLTDVNEIPIPGGKIRNLQRVDEQFTKITLEGFSTITKNYFFNKGKNYLKRKNIFFALDGIDRLKWFLAEDLPIEYENEDFNSLYKNNEPNFTVWINNQTLKRKVYGDTILRTNEGNFEKIGSIKFRYFIVTNFKAIHPPESRFFKIRNLNVGVGERTSFGAGTETGARARLNHLSGEVHILEGMNELISVRRDNFNYSPDFENLKYYLQSKLIECALVLDDLAELEKYFKQTKDEYRINNLSFLEKEDFDKKLNVLREKGYNIRLLPNGSLIVLPIVNIQTDYDEDESLMISSFAKKIIFHGKEFEVKLSKWNYKTEIYPACKFDGNRLIINKNYPLFTKKKYTDLFLKIHIMLLSNLIEKNIDKNHYKHLVNDLDETFLNY